MPYTEQMAHLKQVGVGVVEGAVNGVPKLVMSIASTLWEGAQMQGLSDAGVDPRTSYQIAKQSTSGWWNGELISYDNKEQQLGGFAGELVSPFAYGKAVQ